MPFIEYPKWVGGQIANDPGEEAAILGVAVADLVRPEPPADAAVVPPGYDPIPYPKWVGDKIVNSAEEEAALVSAADAAIEADVEAALRVEDAAPRRGRPPKQ